jgi:hypothetical protein
MQQNINTMHGPMNIKFRDEKCLLRGMDWVFKENSLSFAFKGLNLLAVLFDTYLK